MGRRLLLSLVCLAFAGDALARSSPVFRVPEGHYSAEAGAPKGCWGGEGILIEKPEGSIFTVGGRASFFLPHQRQWEKRVDPSPESGKAGCALVERYVSTPRSVHRTLTEECPGQKPVWVGASIAEMTGSRLVITEVSLDGNKKRRSQWKCKLVLR